MHWPLRPVDETSRFRPPHCPWPSCSEHRRSAPAYRFRRCGGYPTRSGRRVPRFQCLACGRTFSQRAFSTSYYLKRPDLLAPIAAGLVAGSAHRQIARSLGCAPSTVTRQSARLGRHAILLLALALDSLRGSLDEPLCGDHFETFEFSQDLPLGVFTAVGRRSWFVFGVDPAPHRRTGKMTPAQARRLESRPPRETHGGYRASFRRSLDLLLPLVGPQTSLRLACDGKNDYRQVLARHPGRFPFLLECHPNPKRGPKGSPRSPQARARDEAMFAVDQLHALLRHSLANHKRETIAFGRRLNAIMERIFLAAVWRNFVKGRSERRPDRTTPAMRLGLAERPWSWRRLLGQRLFPQRSHLPPVWRELYRRNWITPVLPVNTRHRLRHAS